MGEYISPRMHVVSAIPSYYHLENKKNEMQFQSQNLIFVDVVTFFLLFAFFYRLQLH